MWLKSSTYFVLCLTPKYSENHNSLTVTPNLVVLEPRISLWCVDHYYALYSHVWYDVNFSYAIFVCIVTSRRASDWGAISSTGWRNWAGARWRQTVPLTILIYPIMFSIITVACLCLIWWDLIGHTSFVYFIPWLPLNFWVVLLLL
jgi:hypothetical protein